MAEMKLELGGVFDIASGSDLSSLSDRVDKGFGLLSRRDPKPIMRPMVAAAVQAVNSGSIFLDFGGPASGRVWYIRQLMACYGDAFTAGLTVSASNVAGASTTINLPPGAELQQFTIVSTPAAAAVTVTNVDIANAIGGIQDFSYTFQVTDSGQTYIVNAKPTGPTASIQIVMPAVTGGSSYTMRAVIGNPVAWYISQTNTAPGVSELILPGIHSLPMAIVPGDSDGLFVHYGERIMAQVVGLPVNTAITGVVRVAEFVDSAEEARRM